MRVHVVHLINLVFVFVIMMITKAFNVPIQEAYTLLLLYPPAVVPFTYVTSFLFKTDG